MKMTHSNTNFDIPLNYAHLMISEDIGNFISSVKVLRTNSESIMEENFFFLKF